MIVSEGDKSVFSWAARALAACDYQSKAQLTRNCLAAWQAGSLNLTGPGWQCAQPGRPDVPLLLDPKTLPRRKLGSLSGRAALIHAIAHIEFNAINLALDAVCRFPGMPPLYYGDWLQVAAEEAHHFGLLQAHLQTLGFQYGDFPAHNGL